MADEMLRPCPKCGGDAGLGRIRYSAAIVLENGWDQGTFHTVNCTRCLFATGGLFEYRTQEAAVSAWNRQADPAPVSPYIRDTLARGLRSESEYLAEREGK